MPNESETGVSREEVQDAVESLFGDTAAEPDNAVA